jgi:hypothetical protein
MMSTTTAVVLCTIIPLLLSGFLNHFAHKTWILYFPLIGIALGILYFGHLGIRSLRAPDKTAVSLGKRPYIWLKAAIAKLENLSAPENTPIVELTFENSSDVPAWDVIPKAHAYIATTKLSELPPLPEKPSPSPVRGFFLPANREATHVIGSPKTPDPELRGKIDREEVFIYVFGSVTYKGQANDATRHTTNFCGLYMPKSNDFQQTSFGNETD